MKLNINRPNTKKAREKQTKKEKGRNKSPLKHFSGLKILPKLNKKKIFLQNNDHGQQKMGISRSKDI